MNLHHVAESRVLHRADGKGNKDCIVFDSLWVRTRAVLSRTGLVCFNNAKLTSF